MAPTSTIRPGPPAVNWDELDCTAKFDYIKVLCLKQGRFPKLTGTHKWNRQPHGQDGYTLTVQDPLQSDIQKLIEHLGDPMILSVQLTVDLKPKSTVAPTDLEPFLVETFYAVAGRFRPEDKALWSYGRRGGVDGAGKNPKQFHRRFPAPTEELVYGHRNMWMQSTAYLKRTNEGEDLGLNEQRMRMELTLNGEGVTTFGIVRLSNLNGFNYRSAFTKHFRIVGQPRLRAARGRDDAEIVRLERRMWRAWQTAGVGKFGISHEFPPDTIISNIKQIKVRDRQQLPLSDYILKRDQRATKEIGNAFTQLQRRMAPKKTRAV